MGLCKCPKRKVTTLFCYEHAVNVCEHCIVINHSKCIVQSYMNWLQDSDYKPNCELCGELLKNEECTRLLCYHVFHCKCLKSYMAKLMQNSSETSSLRCPNCRTLIIPKDNMVSPVAAALKEKLCTMVDTTKLFNPNPSNSQQSQGGSPSEKSVSFIPKSQEFILFLDDDFPSQPSQFPRRPIYGNTSSKYVIFDEDRSKFKRRKSIFSILQQIKSSSLKKFWKWALSLVLISFAFVYFLQWWIDRNSAVETSGKLL